MQQQENGDNGIFPVIPRKNRAESYMATVHGMGKLPPQAIELEEAVIGSVMLEPCYEEMRGVLDVEDFYKEANQRIWNACEILQKRGDPIDFMSVTTQLRMLGELEIVGGAHYVTSLTAKVNAATNIQYYARVVAQASMKRKLINWSSEILRRSYEDTEDVFDIYSEASSGLVRIEDGKLTGKDVNIQSQVQRALTRIRTVPIDQIGIVPAYDEVREFIPYHEFGTLNVIAARPSVGKSLYMMNEAIGICQEFHIPTLVISLEMSDLQQVDRALSMVGGVSAERIKKKTLTAEDNKQLDKAGEFISSLPLYISDEPAMNIVEIILMIHKYVRKYGVKNVYIDYLQLIGKDDSKPGVNRNLEVGEMCRLLKIVAMKLRIVINILSQLNRDVKENRPRLDQLRDSGEIEAHIDSCLFLYRPEMAGFKQDNQGRSTEGVLELIFAKNRGGKLGEVEMFMLGEYSRIMSKPPYIATLPKIEQKGGISSQL